MGGSKRDRGAQIMRHPIATLPWKPASNDMKHIQLTCPRMIVARLGIVKELWVG